MKRFLVAMAFCAVAFALNSNAQRTDSLAILRRKMSELDALSAQAQRSMTQGRYVEADGYWEEAIKLLDEEDVTRSLVPTIKETTAINAIHQATSLMKSGKYEEAGEWLEKSERYAECGSKAFLMAHLWHGQLYSLQSGKLKSIGGQRNLQDALGLGEKAEDHFRIAARPDRIVSQQLDRADILSKLSRTSEAAELLDAISDEIKSDVGLARFSGKALLACGNVARDAEDFQKAIQCLEDGYSASLDAGDKRTASLAADGLSQLYKFDIPDSEKERLWQQRSKECGDAVSEEATSDYLRTTKELLEKLQADKEVYKEAIDSMQHGNYEKSIELLSSLISLREVDSDYPIERLGTYHNDIGLSYMHLSQNAKAIQKLKTAISILMTGGDDCKDELQSSWYMLSIAYYNSNMKAETLSAADSCVRYAIESYGVQHSETLDAYSLRSNYEALYGDFAAAKCDRLQCMDIVRGDVVRNFAYLTSSERESYWGTVLSSIRTDAAFAHNMGDSQTAFTDGIYDEQLLAKGILLSTESALRRAIQEDSRLQSVYEEIRGIRKKVRDGKVSKEETEVAVQKADMLERSLGSSADALSSFMEFAQIRHGDVRAQLGDNDIAVEFIDYPVGKDSVMYAALVLSRDSEHARFVPLVDGKALASRTSRRNVESLARIGDVIWKPILDAVGFAPENVYFAPTSLLHLLPIESAKLPDGRFVCDAFNMYRMSSTRWLAHDNHVEMGRDAAVYGGLQYDAVLEETSSGDGTDQRSLATKLAPLPGAKVEAEAIAAAFRKEGKETVSLYSGADGTETSFKALSGTHKRYIHVSTHGFYSNAGGDAMSSCGLCFAGADNVQTGKDLPLDVNDGILTAHEVSEMDLGGSDLITLSACETGIGRITSDGVEGLQRGFKKAGASSMLMSLWNVNDKATAILMTSFYENMLGGMSKRQSLETAKAALRSEKKFSAPIYWAAFVLLDGTD